MEGISGAAMTGASGMAGAATSRAGSFGMAPARSSRGGREGSSGAATRGMVSSGMEGSSGAVMTGASSMAGVVTSRAGSAGASISSRGTAGISASMRKGGMSGAAPCGTAAGSSGAAGVFGSAGTASFAGVPRPFHQSRMAPPTPASAPDTLDTSPPWALVTPSASVVIMRAPESVSCESGPTCASENGRYSRTLANTPSTDSTTDDAMLLMPSTNVESNFAPDSNRFSPPKKSSTAFQASVTPASKDAPNPAMPPTMASHAPETIPLMPSHAAPVAPLAVSHAPCRPERRDAPNPVMPETMESHAPVIVPVMASHFSPAQVAIPPHNSFHHAAISSQFWTSHAPAAIRPAMAMTTSPMGLALMAALRTHCTAAHAFVAADTATMTPRTARSAAFQATKSPST